MLSWLEPGDVSVCRAGGALRPQVQLLTLHLSAQDCRLMILRMSGLRKSGLLLIILSLTKNFADFLFLLGEHPSWRALASAPHHDGHAGEPRALLPSTCTLAGTSFCPPGGAREAFEADKRPSQGSSSGVETAYSGVTNQSLPLHLHAHSFFRVTSRSKRRICSHFSVNWRREKL